MQWTKHSYLFGTLHLLLLSTVADTMADPGAKPLTQAFSNRLLKGFSEEHSGSDGPKNIIFSPMSLEMVLSIAGSGAMGRTKDEISSAVGIPLEIEPMKRRYTPVLVDLKDDPCTLHVATHMFVQNNYELIQNFVNGTVEVFGCGVEPVDFVKEPEVALDSINGWVEGETQGLIKDLLSIDAITNDTRLVLANAVYFKGKWQKPFDKIQTKKSKFTMDGGQQVDVDMMFTDERFRYGDVAQLKAQVLELPYEGERLSMVILLPHKDSSIQELESKVSEADFNLGELLANDTRMQQVMVHLPKFKLELTTNLRDILKKLGMQTMFTDAADFSGITSSPEGLKVSKVVQKAFIEVSEEGTEAAAATGMVMVTRLSIPLQFRKIFKADRPFTFYLIEKQHNTILFAGKFVHFSEQ